MVILAPKLLLRLVLKVIMVRLVFIVVRPVWHKRQTIHCGCMLIVLLDARVCPITLIVAILQTCFIMVVFTVSARARRKEEVVVRCTVIAIHTATIVTLLDQSDIAHKSHRWMLLVHVFVYRTKVASSVPYTLTTSLSPTPLLVNWN